MAIIFWSEFPEQVDWRKANKEIDFETSIYIACKNKEEFLKWKRKIKNRHIKAGAWPVLSKEDGYWFSGQTSKEGIDKLDDFKDILIKIDVEPRIYPGSYNYFKTKIWLLNWIITPGKNKKYLVEKINMLGKDNIVSGFFLPKFLRKGVGMEVNCRRNYICYASLGHKLLKYYYRHMIKKGSKENFFAIGLTNHGIFGNEETYKNKEEFADDFELMKKLGAKNIAVYSLEGVLKKDWLDVIKNYISSF